MWGLRRTGVLFRTRLFSFLLVLRYLLYQSFLGALIHKWDYTGEKNKSPASGAKARVSLGLRVELVVGSYRFYGTLVHSLRTNV